MDNKDSLRPGLVERLVKHQNPTGQRTASKRRLGRRDEKQDEVCCCYRYRGEVLGCRKAKCRNRHVGIKGKEVVSEGHDSASVGCTVVSLEADRR